jgi:hypothetical protein
MNCTPGTGQAPIPGVALDSDQNLQPNDTVAASGS